MRNLYLRLLIVVAVLAIGVTLLGLDLARDLRVFDISPNPMDYYTNITLSFNNRVTTEIYIENNDGQIIKTLFSGVVEKGISLYWDRFDDNGENAPSGRYQVVVNYNTRYTSTKKTLILR